MGLQLELIKREDKDKFQSTWDLSYIFGSSYGFDPAYLKLNRDLSFIFIIRIFQKMINVCEKLHLSLCL